MVCIERTHSEAEVICLRMLMIAAGYKDSNDADEFRSGPMFKMALDLKPSHRERCSIAGRHASDCLEWISPRRSP